MARILTRPQTFTVHVPWIGGVQWASELGAAPRDDDLAHNEIDDRGGRDCDEGADGSAERRPGENCDEHEQRVDLELIALDDRRDHVPLQVLDQNRHERKHERSRAVERGDGEERDAGEPTAHQGEISSPKATITESGIAKGTPIAISEMYVSTPTIAITILRPEVLDRARPPGRATQIPTSYL